VISTGLRFNPIGHLFNARRAIIVVATVDGRYTTSFRDDLTRDTLTVNFRIPRGISFTSFKPRIRHFRKRAGKRRAYMRTPPSCPATGAWTTTVVFIYRDGSTQELTAATPCRR
jgi:hypothetical protein